MNSDNSDILDNLDDHNLDDLNLNDSNLYSDDLGKCSSNLYNSNINEYNSNEYRNQYSSNLYNSNLNNSNIDEYISDEYNSNIDDINNTDWIDRVQLVLAFAALIMSMVLLILQVNYENKPEVTIYTICSSCNKSSYIKVKSGSSNIIF